MDKQERHAKERIAFEEFKTKLNKVKTFSEAQVMVKQSRPDSPGRIYYSRFGYFLQGFDIPAGLSDEEKLLYEKFVEQLDSTGQLNPGAGQKIKNKLNLDIEP